jgi:hypothetical protein
MADEKIIGIDLGTTNSVVAVMEGNEVKVIPNQEGNRITPSVVAFTEKGEVLVGDPAKRQAITNPKRTIYSIKRFMGRRHNEVEAEEKLVPYTITGAPGDLVKVKVGDKEYTPPEISAMILRKLKEAAENYLRSLGLRECRVRVHPGELARIEVPADQVRELLREPFREQLTAYLLSLGFRFVTVDLQGLRSGSLNVMVDLETRRRFHAQVL